MELIPKVVYFTQDDLKLTADGVDLARLESSLIMQGVFRLAGIWEERARLLTSTTLRRNHDDLREASHALTERIRENWTQGHDLEFILEYVNSEIRLTVKDRAKTVTGVGERSQGFTAYFAMRMLLVARTEAAQPNGFIFIF